MIRAREVPYVRPKSKKEWTQDDTWYAMLDDLGRAYRDQQEKQRNKALEIHQSANEMKSEEPKTRRGRPEWLRKLALRIV